MSINRTPDERRTDAALLLVLWRACAQRPREDAGDKLRQMKLAFLATHRLAEERVRALHLSFYRWTWGPMSNEVYEAWETLERAGLIESEERFVFSRAGESLAESFYQDVLRDERNTLVRESFERIVADWRETPETEPLLKAVYAMELAPIGSEHTLRVKDIRKGEELIQPVDVREAQSAVAVDPGWLETLALTLVPGAAAPIHTAVSDYRGGRFRVA